MTRAALACAAAALVAGACTTAPRAEPPSRRVSIDGVPFDAAGVSTPVRVAVPARTRSLTVVVRGAPAVLYALASLETADGVEHVQLPRGEGVGAAMRESYVEEKVGLMPGQLYQSIRLGLFTQVFPDRPGRALPPGEVTLRVATSDPGTPADVEVLMPEDSGARRLPLRVFSVSDRFRYGDPEPLPFLSSLREVLGGGGVEVDVEGVVGLPGSSLSAMTEASQPQEPPTSASSQLALLGGSMIEGDALAIFIVDELPGGVAGWSLGTPGPPLPDTIYSGVVVARRGSPDEVGRVMAHEIAHYLGVAHLENVARSGARHPDPLDDTTPGSGNLMEGGRALTGDQAWVLARSALLR